MCPSNNIDKQYLNLTQWQHLFLNRISMRDNLLHHSLTISNLISWVNNLKISSLYHSLNSPKMYGSNLSRSKKLKLPLDLCLNYFKVPLPEFKTTNQQLPALCPNLVFKTMDSITIPRLIQHSNKTSLKTFRIETTNLQHL